jgi:hypothetical protein
MDPDELENLRRDIEVLRTTIESALTSGAAGQDPLVRASAATLQNRLHRLEQLEENRGLADTG